MINLSEKKKRVFSLIARCTHILDSSWTAAAAVAMCVEGQQRWTSWRFIWIQRREKFALFHDLLRCTLLPHASIASHEMINIGETISSFSFFALSLKSLYTLSLSFPQKLNKCGEPKINWIFHGATMAMARLLWVGNKRAAKREEDGGREIGVHLWTLILPNSI